MEEFYALGDMEHNHGLVVTEIFKRDTSRAKVQLGFLQHFVKPLFESIEKNIDGVTVSKMISNIQSNIDYWEKLIHEENA